MPLLDTRREEAETQIATLRTQLMTARETAEALAREATAINRELGDSQSDRESIYGPHPDSVIGKLAIVRLARYRANSDKPSAEELRLAARRDVLVSALVGVRRGCVDASAQVAGAQIKFERAVSRFGIDYPSEGAQMVRLALLQPVP